MAISFMRMLASTTAAARQRSRGHTTPAANPRARLVESRAAATFSRFVELARELPRRRDRQEMAEPRPAPINAISPQLKPSGDDQ